ncbi:MAG TPA: large conductance mechanosensitive channel protein MscL [Candidatus Binataceae bacterium]|nr:large conductance mechanosensitive channel protein MscL [Candidatus Binataceae bacterium]
MAFETEDLETDLHLAQRFQQLYVRKTRPKYGGPPMNGFKQFLLRGNVIDMAVGIVVGAAFGTVVSAFVKDLLTPFIAAVVHKPDFSGIAFTINSSKFMIGDFINQLISFLLVAAAVYFAIVMPVTRLMARLEPPPAPTTKTCPECLSEIPIAAKRCAHCTSTLAA